MHNHSVDSVSRSVEAFDEWALKAEIFRLLDTTEKIPPYRLRAEMLESMDKKTLEHMLADKVKELTRTPEKIDMSDAELSIIRSMSEHGIDNEIVSAIVNEFTDNTAHKLCATWIKTLRVAISMKTKSVSDKFWPSAEEIKSRIDIVDVVNYYTNWKLRSDRMNIKCPFPWHNDWTASFHVYSKTWYCKCFWCHKSWSVIDFVMHMEDCSFRKAIEILSKF